MSAKAARIVSPEVSAALAKAREDDSCDETFSSMLGAVYAAAKALRDVPGARISVGDGAALQGRRLDAHQLRNARGGAP